MLYYRGDKFVKGKKFTINEAVYKFVKKTKNEELIFESVDDNSTLKILENEFAGVETLVEKINQENKEINELIGKILRSKSLARKHEGDLAKYGIKIDYDQGQGVTLTGPNGKRLNASTKEVFGPSKPGFNNTHRKPDSWYSSRVETYTNFAKEAQEKLDKYESMDRDDIIRMYNDKSTEEALALHNKSIESLKQSIANYKKQAEENRQYGLRDRQSVRREKRAGHDTSVNFHDKSMYKDKANKTVDYLNYLVKPATDKPFKNYNQGHLAGDSKQDTSRNSYYDSHYYGRNGKPGVRSARLSKYDDLKANMDYARQAARNSSQGSGSWNSYKSEEELEQEIQSMRDDLERRINELRANNNRRKDGNQKDIEELKIKEKELDDYLKSLGIRESVRAEMVKNTLLKESAKPNVDASYFNGLIVSIMEDLEILVREASDAGLLSLKSAAYQGYDALGEYKFVYDNVMYDGEKVPSPTEEELNSLRENPDMKLAQEIADKYNILPSEVIDQAGLTDEDLGLTSEE